MKKIYFLTVAAAGMLTLSSCSDFLDQQSESELVTETVYENVYYTGQQINKIYGQLTNDRTYSQDFAFIYNSGSDIELVDGLGDNAYNGTSERGALNYYVSTAWSKLANSWTYMYNVVEQANLAIDGIRNSSIADDDDMKEYLGEALTLRAMTYFDILRTWGDVPMKLEPTQSDLSNAYQGKTDRDEIMDTLMVDLEEAIEYLPWASTSWTTEHVNKGYAHALLAQIALTRAGYCIRESAKSGYETASYSDATYPTQRPDASTRQALYEKALEHLSAVISDGPHSLNPSFENEWYLINQLTLDQTYYENLFEIPMLRNVSGELGYTVGVRMNGNTSEYGYSNSSGKMKVTAPYFYSFQDGDTRRDITVSPMQIKEDNSQTIEEMLGNAPFALYVGKWDPRKMSDEWLSENLTATAKHMTGINVVKIRYSQVLLWYAEVMNELAGPDGSYTGSAGLTARQALALVHNRAFNDTDYASAAAEYVNNLSSDKDSFFDAIVDENAWELAGEGARKYDLIRWNLLVEKTQQFKKDYVEGLSSGEWPETIYFNYSNAGKTKLDMSSVTWTAEEANAAAANTSAYDGNAAWVGKFNDTQFNTNLPSLFNGLYSTTVTDNGDDTYSISFSDDASVKNRYLMPLGETTISDSNGTLSNSYGY